MEDTISLEQINANLRDAFGVDAIEDRERKAAKKVASAQPAEVYQPVDIYQRDVNARWEESQKKRPKGSSMLVKAVTQSVINGDVPGAGLAHAYKRAEDDSDSLKERGEIERADIARKQYMEERFIPAIETVVNYTSPDELLNCKDALDALDKYALGVGTPKGYTAAYVRSAYGDLLGQDLNGILDRSDDAVIEAVRKIMMFSNMGDNRTAVGIAKKIKKSIDSGSNLASDDDYAIIGRVAAFGN